MKKVPLSDHTQYKLDRAVARREAGDRADVVAWERAKAAVEQHKQERRGRMLAAWRTWKLSEILGTALEYLDALPSVPAEPVKREPSAKEEQWRAGVEGERDVQNFLDRKLDDEWTLLSGYQTRAGEIDIVLVGPSEILAVEVKNTNGVVHCDGDLWCRDKYDQYDHLVKSRESIHDGTERGPSRQINETADALEVVLRGCFGSWRVRRVVVLSHVRSERGDLKNVTVDWVVTLDDWDLSRLRGHEARINAQERAEIVSAIRRDHAYQDERSRRYRERRNRDKA